MRYLEAVADRLARAPIPWITGRRRARRWSSVSGARRAARLVVARRTAAPAAARCVGIVAVAPAPRVDERDLGRPAERAHGPVLRRRAGGLGAAHLARGASRSWSTAARTPPRSRPSSSALGVKRLDLVVASHPHADHVVGLPAVLARVPRRPAARARLPRATRPTAPRSPRPRRAEHVAVRHPRAGDVLAGRRRPPRDPVAGPLLVRDGVGHEQRRDRRSARASARTRSCSRPNPRSRRSRCCSTRASISHADVLKVPHHGGGDLDRDVLRGRRRRGRGRERRPEHLRPPGPRGPRLRSARPVREVLRTDRAGDVTVTFEVGGLLVESAA